jgi:prevent-host-death family protein
MEEGAKVVTTGIQDARDRLRTYVDAALAERQHTVIERHGKPVAVLVPIGWYVAKGGDPREPLDRLAGEGQQ